MITLALALAASIFGYVRTRGFVRRRLMYVDAVQNGAAPILAGVAAAVVAGILPLIGAGPALLFGAAVGAGVRAGARDTRRRRITA
jgi:hypothetical protein